MATVEQSVTFRLRSAVLRILKASENRAQPVRPHCSYVCPSESEANSPGPPAFISILSAGEDMMIIIVLINYLDATDELALIICSRTLRAGNDNNMRLNRYVSIKKN